MKPVWIAVLLLALTIPPAMAAEDKTMEGQAAPSFRLQDQYGEWHQLSDYKNQWLVLYFYPKDDTPGCTTQACDIRDNIYEYRKLGAAVVGVSLDDVNSHKKFSDKYKLPFRILADTDGKAAKAYGVFRNLKIARMAKRQSFLINPEGVIAKHYKKVKPDKHNEEVLADLREHTAP